MNTKIIYILGHGRSGSTLLDLLISTQKGIASIGQFVGFENSVKNSSIVKCTCGKTSNSCIQWSSVMNKQKKLLTKDKKTFSDSPFFQKGRRLKQLSKSVFFFIRGGIVKISSFSDQHHSELVKSICESSNCTYLVDSSKNINRYLSLHQSVEIEVITIFLIRDMTGVCRSKNKAKSERRSGILLASLSWAIQNISSALIYKRTAGRKIFVTYDQILSDPDLLLKRVFRETKIDINLIPTNRHIDTQSSHMISGNSIKKDKTLYIAEQKEQTLHLSYKEHFFSKVIATPVNSLVSFLCKPT